MNEIIKLRYVALFTAVVLTTLGVVLLAWQFSSVVALVLVSVAVAAMMRAPVKWVAMRGISQGLAMAIIYAFGILIILGVSWFALPRISVEMESLMQDFSKSYASLVTHWPAGNLMTQNLARTLNRFERLNALVNKIEIEVEAAVPQ